jgi:hypothetical protein
MRTKDETRRTWASHLTGGLLCGMAATAAYGLGTGPATTRYAVVLVGSVLLATLGTAGRMWTANCFESRLAAVVLAALTVVGQVLTMTLGEPGTGAGTWHPAGLAVVALGVAVPFLVLVDARLGTRSRTPVRPYAL